MDTVRVTTAEAIVRYLIAQRTRIDGETVPLFPGVSASTPPLKTARNSTNGRR